MSETLQSSEVQDDFLDPEVLLAAIESSGLRKDFIAKQFGRSPSWLSKVLSGHIKITDELRLQFEEILKLKLIPFESEIPSPVNTTTHD